MDKEIQEANKHAEAFFWKNVHTLENKTTEQ